MPLILLQEDWGATNSHTLRQGRHSFSYIDDIASNSKSFNYSMVKYVIIK